MAMTDNTPWRPGMLAAGAAHPECDEWPVRFMSLFLEDAARGMRPDASTRQLRGAAAMHRAAMDANLIIRGLMS